MTASQARDIRPYVTVVFPDGHRAGSVQAVPVIGDPSFASLMMPYHGTNVKVGEWTWVSVARAVSEDKPLYV